MKFTLGFCKKNLEVTNAVNHSIYFVMVKYFKSPSLLEPMHKTTTNISFLL